MKCIGFSPWLYGAVLFCSLIFGFFPWWWESIAPIKKHYTGITGNISLVIQLEQCVDLCTLYSLFSLCLMRVIYYCCSWCSRSLKVINIRKRNFETEHYTFCQFLFLCASHIVILKQSSIYFFIKKYHLFNKFFAYRYATFVQEQIAKLCSKEKSYSTRVFIWDYGTSSFPSLQGKGHSRWKNFWDIRIFCYTKARRKCSRKSCGWVNLTSQNSRG